MKQEKTIPTSSDFDRWMDALSIIGSALSELKGEAVVAHRYRGNVDGVNRATNYARQAKAALTGLREEFSLWQRAIELLQTRNDNRMLAATARARARELIEIAERLEEGATYAAHSQ
jgi:hypothetical protein